MVRLPEVALPLGRFLREDVAAICVAAFVLAGSGLPEALCSPAIGLDLGHWGSLRNQHTGRGGGLLRKYPEASTLSVLPAPVVSH